MKSIYIGIFLALSLVSFAFADSVPIQGEAVETPRPRRWGLSPQVGAAFMLSRVHGFDMNPALSIGARFTFDIWEWMAVGVQLKADFVHFSDSSTQLPGSMDMSSLTPLLLAEFKPRPKGIFFGPMVGLSEVAFAYRKGGFLAFRDEKGTDSLLAVGGFAGWNFGIGRKHRVFLGPRVDVYHYVPLHTKFIGTHTGANALFFTKFTF